MEINWEASFAVILRQQYEKLRDKNPRYSMRSFAKKLGISIATLSQVMRSQLKLSRKRAIVISKKLELSARDKKRVRMLLGQQAELEKVLMSPEDQELQADWVTSAILYSFDLDQESPSAAELAKRLSISVLDAEKKINELIKRNYLEKDEEGRLFRPDKIWKTPDGDVNEFVRKTHESNLELTAKAFRKIPIEERDYTALMFAGNRRQLEAVRKEIRHFYDRILVIMEESPRDELYQMAISLYPINFDGKSGKKGDL